MPKFLENEDTSVKERIIVKKPSMYKVIMLNDDYTTMDFVVDVLMEIFNKNEQDAETIMMNIDKTGRGLCGVYSRELAETKVTQVHARAKDEGCPLKCIIEKE